MSRAFRSSSLSMPSAVTLSAVTRFVITRFVMPPFVMTPFVIALSGVMLAPRVAAAATSIRIMPPDRAAFAVGQRFDLRVEATNDQGPTGAPPQGLTVTVNGADITARNILDAGAGGVRGAGGTGATDASLAATATAGSAAKSTTNFLVREYSFARAGTYAIAARTADGATAQVTVTATAWDARRPGLSRARNIIFLLGDGMGIAHRTAARIVSRGVADGKAKAPLAMDTLEVTGQVITFALNSVITDSAPGMSSYATGQKANNNQEGVFPDNTGEVFDNPRVEYIGEMLKRVRGKGFNVGIVTTADVTDATPAANAVHTADRNAGPRIAERFFEERQRNGVTVLLGGGRRQFVPRNAPDSNRRDDRNLLGEFTADGYRYLSTKTELAALLKDPATPPPAKLLGLFQPQHLSVAFDRVGAGRYSDELAQGKHKEARDQPGLDDMARLALRSLSAHSPAGFYLLLEGASIDKQAHASDAERTIWDTIEFDNTVRIALEFADRTNSDRDPTNDTLVIVTADHESGGLGIIGVGNERFAPATFGSAVRDYAAVFRFAPTQILNFLPNYEPDAQGFPINPDPSRKLLLGWAAGPDRYENWISNRLMLESSRALAPKDADAVARRVSVANPLRDGNLPDSDNKTVDGQRIPGFLVPGTIENGQHACLGTPACPGDTSPEPHTIAGHTGSDVPLSASGPGALQFTGTYDNTDVFLKMLKAAAGSYDTQVRRRPTR